jgi:hypothetical protein
VLSLVTWSIAFDATEPKTTLAGRLQAGALPEVGVGVIVQTSCTVPVKDWVGVIERAFVTDCPGGAIVSELLAAASVKLGPAVTWSGSCTVWLC